MDRPAILRLLNAQKPPRIRRTPGESVLRGLDALPPQANLSIHDERCLAEPDLFDRRAAASSRCRPHCATPVTDMIKRVDAG